MTFTDTRRPRELRSSGLLLFGPQPARSGDHQKGASDPSTVLATRGAAPRTPRCFRIPFSAARDNVLSAYFAASYRR